MFMVMDDSHCSAKNKSRSVLDTDTDSASSHSAQFHFPPLHCPLTLTRTSTPGNSQCQSQQGCGFHCLPGVKAGMMSAVWNPAVSEGCVCPVQWLFAEPVGFSWFQEGSRSWSCCHSAQPCSLQVGRLCPVCIALPPIPLQTLGAADILQFDRRW